ncbi:MAG TPA: ABC transporter substrate-binding protein [Candidatus Polarisedimenticolaceae bacterium]|nr:ABC transporter substrate-binding protein [Candidatus Polarisedimenticolaceae bacterium]
MKQWTIIISFIGILLSRPTAIFSAETALKIVNVAVPAVSLLQAPLFTALDAGAFKKYGMEVRYVVTGARTIQALVGGSVQFAQGVSSRTVPAAVLAGADTVLIANFSDKLLFTMHSAPEVKSLQDLRGKVVGVSGIGGSTDFATRLALREAGLIPEKDVAIRGVGGVPETVAALKAKVVQAGTLSPPSSFVAQKAGFKMLFDMSSLGVDYISSGLGVKKAAIASNRQEVKQFLMAMIEGAKILTSDEEFALRVLGKHTRISDREILKQSYSYLRPYFLKVPYPSARAIKDTLDILSKEIPRAKDADPEEFIDNSVVKEIEASGYIENIYGK